LKEFSMEDVQRNKFCGVGCISWTAIFVGALVGVGLGFLLNLFSAAIGLSAFSTSPEGVSAFAMGGFIGFAIGVIVTMFVSGMVAGALGRHRCPQCNLGALYGFSAWVVALIFIVLLAAPAAKYVSANTLMLNSHAVVVHTPTEAVAAVAPTPEAAHDMAKTAFALFALFFLGAVSASLGGHYAMASCAKKDYCKPTPTM
jgi:hypothetical protein